MKVEAEAILPAWAETFENAAKWLKEKKEAFEEHLFGNNVDTPMEKYGFKIATDLLSKYVATGKIYKDDVPALVPTEEKIKRMSSAVEDVFKADRDLVKDHAKAVKEGKVEEGKKCEIY